MPDHEAWREMRRLGKKMVASGLTTSRFGNISLRMGDTIAITRTGSMLDELDSSEVVEVGLVGPCPAEASSETCVHRAIYRGTSHSCVIHTHSPYAVALSLLEDRVEPLDSEGIHFLGSLAVVEGDFGTEELAGNVAAALKDHKACIALGHGVFAAGKSLLEAYEAACMAEHSSQVRFLVMLGKKLFLRM
jgi:L-fuculose-phosphate aldolase